MLIRILLAFKEKKMREGLRTLLEKYDEFVVAAEGDRSEGTITITEEFKPDVVVMDSVMPGLESIEAIRSIVAKAPDAKVISLPMNLERCSVVKMLKAGTSGYVLKESAFEALIDTLHRIGSGNSLLVRAKGKYVHKQTNEESRVISILTPRELEVLKLVAEGRSTPQIACEIDISMKTVDSHRQHIMDKLNIRGIADLTRYAIRKGISPL